MVLLYAPFAHARAPLLKQPQNRLGCDSQNNEEGIRRHYHESSDCAEYPKNLFQIKPPKKSRKRRFLLSLSLEIHSTPPSPRAGLS